MPISEDEARRLIDHIEKTVREVADDSAGIMRLIDQWKADVEAGRSIERKLTAGRRRGHESSADTSLFGPATSGDFVGKEDYTNLEQLDMLVVSLGLAFVAPSMMSERLLDTIEDCRSVNDRGKEPDLAVHFKGIGTAGSLMKPLHVSRKSVEQSYGSTEELTKLLNEIVGEAGLKRRRLVSSEDGA